MVPHADNETILVADSDKENALGTAESLRGQGRRVVVAHSHSEAIELVEENSSIGLAIIDLGSADGSTGPETAAEILTRRELPILFQIGNVTPELLGRARAITSYGYVQKGSDGLVLGELVALALELFDKNQAANRRYRRHHDILQSLRETIVTFDKEGRFRFVNERAALVLGDRPERLIGKALVDLVPRENAEAGFERISYAFESGESTSSEATVVINGETRWFDVRYQPIRGDDGQVERVLQIGFEVTERVLSQIAQRENAERYRLLAENSSDAILVHDHRFAYLFISPSTEELLGYSPEELKNLRPMHAVHPEDLESLQEAVRKDMSSGAAGGLYEHRVYTKSGELKWVESRARYLYDASGAMERVVVSMRDATERKRVELELAEERDRVRQLAGYQKLLLDEIHHRVKNDMNFVKSLLSLQASEADNPQTKYSLNEAAKRVTVVGKVYERLHRSGNFKVMNVGELVEELAESLRAGSLPTGGNLKVSTDEFVVPTRESVSLGIIINELVTNAAKYAFHDSATPVIQVSVSLEGENRVRLTVRDNGCGFPEPLRRGEGFGYGLTIVDALVGQHGGTLMLRNDAGGVATVVIPFQL